ncbi:Inositol phosphorylceramide glucuronosyltransferase 1 [Hondaea fermentalgiana]|uniref:Inositol phosphorylceramide glucuronosyltransferase 1 n=1 Tax=Hondaea fermentalgiana TaxID=2315210 RepID=A0A2R5GGU8_9STRA|nr:Inositol phosphorylceramide glucuronosyltransferase 1 [Hondaea fermentalgiana]|eukprot:GBG30100.1 Inositol phosphorylceramide glucuronosyltransferase 1 [Hondaea fermentalgiana]
MCGDARPIHSADESRVVQYSFKDVTSPPKAAVIDLLARVDRAVASFESQRAGQIPKRVLYATLLTPAPTEGYTHSTTSAVFKQHHVSKFRWGQIPWENQAIIYTEDAFPEFRQWLKDRGGHVFRVPPLLCDKARDKRYRYQFTKLQFWNLTDWDMIVYTDLDTLITGDISNLWSSCPDDYNLCTIDEPRYFEIGYTYSNGGVLLVRPKKEFYDFIIEGRRTYQNRTFLCEQDFFNFFLTNRQDGIVDPKYNTMGFDPKRTTRFQEGKILHFDLRLVNELYEGVTPAERDFVNQIIVKLDKEGAAFPDPASNTT